MFDAMFGELRSLLSSTQAYTWEWSRALLALVGRYEELYPNQYVDICLPYLLAQSIDWPKPLMTFYTTSALEEAARLLPCATWSLVLDVHNGGMYAPETYRSAHHAFRSELLAVAQSTSRNRIAKLVLDSLDVDLNQSILKPEASQEHEFQVDMFQNADEPSESEVPVPWTELVHLESSHNYIGSRGVRRLLELGMSSSLETLIVSGGEIDSDGAVALAYAPSSRTLRHLDLSVNPLHARGASAISHSPVLGNLEELRMSSCGLGLQSLYQLLATPKLPNVAVLDLSHNDMSHNTMRLPVHPSPRLRSLQRLNLSNNHLDTETLKNIFTQGLVGSVEELNVSHNQLDMDVFRGAPFLTKLKTLDISSNLLSDEDVWEHFVAQDVFGMERLQMKDNMLGELGIKALGEGGVFRNVSALDLCLNRLPGQGVSELAKHIDRQSLRQLHLSGNPIGDVGAEALAMSESVRGLTTLVLRSAEIGAAGAMSLAESDNVSNLTCLDLSWNALGDEGAMALATSPLLSKLETLRIEGVDLGEAGVRALARSPHLHRLTLLHVGSNHLGQRAQTLLRHTEHLQDTKVVL